MHPVAKRCLIWAGVLLAVGVLMSVYGTNLLVWFQDVVGFNAEPALHVFGIVTAVLHNFAMPLAAALVGAAVVIQTLAPRGAADAAARTDARATESA
ncbi:hypothetical protein [Demequina lignilytica]|uniref:Uncharacterized protein n=1 Tax=Demequina lignilytica TaxID=3051663 RepID=A0AAW7M9R8_9MICO|nr:MULTISPECIES: hypothetical protein [unclassified Demequina]MDN4478812.1 hypothetical protein [Demequina sp. SYSU T00039-1]MDN4484089.1 hypothetical protein [Demequina sp. SYSU T0a273]MDN4488910.1 hypothetical protein [Demequina sp. SYSU T00039]MDN4490328.1 hypothetical protein [Demequina sp. SYSU T00068]